ncbi:MAG: hypothetical protein M1825_000437 [Sarcosagium campestre]|nr:MAG: hypothetical protein M1825_000437 [Sarcosagium campestre]
MVDSQLSGMGREDDIDDDEVGLPQLTDPFIKKYLQGRDALIAQEKKQRSDQTFREALSPVAAEACSIVSSIREEERRNVWAAPGNEGLARDQESLIHSGMMFSLAKPRMEGTRLWQIVRAMPKGALLHAHFDAMVDVDWLIEQALATPGLHIEASDALCSPRALELTQFSFRFAKSQSNVSNLWSTDYKQHDLMPVLEAAENFPSGGRLGFIKWLKGRCTITNEESLRHHHGPNDIWKKFKSTFSVLGSMIFYEPIFRASVRRVCQQLLEDGVRWVDFRAAFVFEYRRESTEEPEQGYDEVIRVFGEEVERFKASEEGRRFWGARMIWTTIRIMGRREIVQSMKQCIAVKKAYPHLIAGFDLVGQEDLGRPLKDLTPELFWFRKRCVEEGVEIPFFFHAGETLGDGDEVDSNIVDALLLGTRRIGHGFSLYKHPLLIDMVKAKKILVESCPISNEVLRLTHSIMSHPLPALLSRGVAVSLCNDDPAILGQGTNGLSYDFWQVLQGLENVGLEGLGSLADNSVRWAAFEDQSSNEWLQGIKEASLGKGIRASRMKEWALEWERFCQWIVDEFGGNPDSE